MFFNTVAIPMALLAAMLATVVVLAVELIARLHASGWNIQREAPRAFALGAADIVFVLMLVKPDALFVYASLAFGIMLAGAAVSCAHKARLGTHNSTAPTYNAIVTALLAMASAFVLVAPQDTFADCSFGLGITLLVCAIGALYE